MSRLFLNGVGKIADLLRSCRSDRRGNVAIITAFAMIPMIGLVGLGTDYGVALTDKSKLDNAADTAAVAAVAGAKAYVAANQNDPNLSADAIAAGLNQASRSFIINMGNLPFAPVPTPVTSTSTAPSTNTCGQPSACIYLTQSGQTFTSTVYYRTATQNHFGQLFGATTMNLAGTSAATAQIPSYLDFYLLVDVSGSMGLPATSAGQSTLMSQFGCQFACHFPGQTSAYNYAQSNNIQLRSGAVNTAVCGLLSLALQDTVVQQQYRIGVYPYITQMSTLAALTYVDTNYNSLQTSTGCNQQTPTTFTSLLDTGTTQLYTGNNPSTGIGSGGTHFETIFGPMQSTILHFGNGSTSNQSRPFVFLITDGMQNSQHYAWNSGGTYYYPGKPSTFNGYSNANFDGSSPAYMNSSLCAALKSANVTISVLYIPYINLTVGNTDQGETIAANNASPNLQNALTSCASPGYFTTANTPNDINNALQAMFNQAVQAAHLTQ